MDNFDVVVIGAARLVRTWRDAEPTGSPAAQRMKKRERNAVVEHPM